MKTPAQSRFLHQLLNTSMMVLRNYETLPHTTGGSDVDVLVLPGEAEEQTKRVRECALGADGAVIGFARSESFSKATVFGQSRDSGEWWGVCIDIFDGLSFRGADLIDTEFAFDTAARHDAIIILPDGNAAVVAVLKELLNNGSLPGKYCAAAKAAFLKEEDKLHRLLAPMGQLRWSV